MTMTFNGPMRDVARELKGIAVVALAVLALVSVLSVWFGGLDLAPTVIRNLPFGLLLSALITATATGLCTLAVWLTDTRPAVVRWTAYYGALLLAAVIGTLLTPVVFVVIGAFPPRAIPINFEQNIRGTVVVTAAVGTLLMLAREWRVRLDSLRQELTPKTSGERQRVQSRVGAKVEFVDLAAVSYVYAQDKLTFAVTPAKHHPLDLSIAELEEKLQQGRWVRIHRKTLVNAETVRELHTDGMGRLFVRMSDGTELRVARDRAAQVRAALKG